MLLRIRKHSYYSTSSYGSLFFSFPAFSCIRFPITKALSFGKEGAHPGNKIEQKTARKGNLSPLLNGSLSVYDSTIGSCFRNRKAAGNYAGVSQARKCTRRRLKESPMNSQTDAITREYFNSILITPRYLDAELPDLSVDLFGKTFRTPVMTAALSHLHSVCDNGMVAFARGARDAGALHFVGMGEDAELEEILATGADTVKIIKPHADDEVIYRKIEHAVSHGATAVGMDIDHAVSHNGTYDNVFGLPMHTKTTVQLAGYVKAAGVPFVVKGVLSAADAEKSVEAGAAAIIVSHHHGIMDCMVPPLLVLPEIVKAVNGQAKIFVDCDIENGLDIFKALALGADAVGVGRTLMDALKNGAEGVTSCISRLNSELATAMARTGARTISEIDPSVLRFRSF